MYKIKILKEKFLITIFSLYFSLSLSHLYKHDKYTILYKLYYTYVLFFRVQLIIIIYLYKLHCQGMCEYKIYSLKVLPYNLDLLQYQENHQHNLEHVSVSMNVQNDLDHPLQD